MLRAAVITFVVVCDLVGCTLDSGAGRDIGVGAAQVAAADGGGVVSAPLSWPVYDASILSFVAANAYHDFPLLDTQRDSKFEVFLLPTIAPEEVESVVVDGPDGFSFTIANAPFSDSLNGYILDERQPALWYQAIRAGELADGRYTVRVEFTNGEQQEYSRVLTANPEMVEFYLAHRTEMRFEPNGGTSPAGATVLTWSTLGDLRGPDAYYNAWISSGTADAISGLNLRGDTIFLNAVLDPSAGLNLNNTQLGTILDPLPVGPVTWQVEILDSNQLDGIDQIIFPPGQHFVVE